MKMPRCESAIIAKAKITDYLLSPTHPRGSTKAKWFNALGYAHGRPEDLMASLSALAKLDVESTEETRYGTKYVISGDITGPNGRRGTVRTIWMLLDEAEEPKLVTAYPEK